MLFVRLGNANTLNLSATAKANLEAAVERRFVVRCSEYAMFH